MFVDGCRGRVSRPVFPDRYNVANRAGQAVTTTSAPCTLLPPAMPAGRRNASPTNSVDTTPYNRTSRRGRVSRPVLHDRHNVANRAGQGSNDHLRTKHELSVGTADPSGEGCHDTHGTLHESEARTAGPGGETPPLRILSIQRRIIVHLVGDRKSVV